jgi:acyl-CoA thioester hydrolase
MAGFTHSLRVRYHECDAQGIVFNANHFAYFDITLTELWREAFGSYGSLVQAGADVLVAHAEATFHAPARFDDVLNIDLVVERLGTTSMVVVLHERRGSETLATGRLVHVFVDPESLAKLEIPAAVRKQLIRYAAEPAAVCPDVDTADSSSPS